MPDNGLRVAVDRDSIVITQPGANSLAVYFRPRAKARGASLIAIREKLFVKNLSRRPAAMIGGASALQPSRHSAIISRV
jgi:hypothetical protein